MATNMKHISSFFRTLFFTALLCMTSVSAMAHDLIQPNEGIDRLTANGDRITVLGGNVRIKELTLEAGYAVIVLPGADIVITNLLDSRGTIYIFGTLDASSAVDGNNSGIIYSVGGGQLSESKNWFGDGAHEVEESEALNKTIKYEGKPATETEHGLKDYWEKGIEFNGDYCPIFYYEDEACTNTIYDIEKWKENERIIYSLPLYKKEAIEAIRSAMQGETSAYLAGLVQTQIDIIYSTGKEGEIESAKNAAIEILNGVIDAYKTIKAEAVGTLGTKQDGPALIVTDKDDKEFIFYSPKSVEYIKVKEK